MYVFNFSDENVTVLFFSYFYTICIYTQNNAVKLGNGNVYIGHYRPTKRNPLNGRRQWSFISPLLLSARKISLIRILSPGCVSRRSDRINELCNDDYWPTGVEINYYHHRIHCCCCCCWTLLNFSRSNGSRCGSGGRSTENARRSEKKKSRYHTNGLR